MKLSIIGASIVAVLTSLSAQASDQIFPETYVADTLPKGAVEGEHWDTYQEGKSQGTYGLIETRTEIEYGITSRWQASLYINTYSVKAHDDNSSKSRVDYTSSGGDGDEITGGGPGTFGAYVPNSSRFPVPSAYYAKTDFDSVSLETIYNFLSPYTDAIGLSGYLEYSYGDHFQEIELKTLLQKNFIDDKVILAANLVLDLEKNSYALTATEKETEIELTGGASVRLSPHFRTGVEARNTQGFTGYSAASGNHAYSVWFAGPMVSFTTGKFFAMLGYQRQLPWAEAFNHATQVEQISGLNYYEYEKNFVRFRMSYAFR